MDGGIFSTVTFPLLEYTNRRWLSRENPSERLNRNRLKGWLLFNHMLTHALKPAELWSMYKQLWMPGLLFYWLPDMSLLCLTVIQYSSHCVESRHKTWDHRRGERYYALFSFFCTIKIFSINNTNFSLSTYLLDIIKNIMDRTGIWSSLFCAKVFFEKPEKLLEMEIH